jgi:hypothetical protein
MSLIVEDGTGRANAQSYASVAEADAYHAAHGNVAWTGADALKEAALVRATAWLDAAFYYRWPSVKMNHTQALEFPRLAATDVEGYALDPVPAELKTALYEAALVELVSPGRLSHDDSDNGTIKAESEGGVSKTYNGKKNPSNWPLIYTPLRRILLPAGHPVVRA